MTTVSRTLDGESNRRYSISEYLHAFENRARRKLNKLQSKILDPSQPQHQNLPSAATTKKRVAMNPRKQPHISSGQSVVSRHTASSARRIVAHQKKRTGPPTVATASKNRATPRVAGAETPCKCCAVKEQKIQQQAKELQQMKLLVEGMYWFVFW